MRKTKYYVSLSSDESRIILLSLIRMKNRLTQQGRYTDCVDELIAKISICLHKTIVKEAADFSLKKAAILLSAQEAKATAGSPTCSEIIPA